MERPRRYLFVVAHPDDEVLAAGGTIRKLAQQGHQVYVCIMNSVSDIRCKDSETMIEDMMRTHKMLGVHAVFIGDFETMKFNVTPQIKLVAFIEDAIKRCQPDVVFTHHPSDLHNDHYNTAIACRTAVRLPQRRIADINPIKQFYYMEVPSSTDWAANGCIGEGFSPNTYSEISEDDFDYKIMALKMYQEGGVLREEPHPRNDIRLYALAMKRGSEIGCELAEAFQLVFSGGL